VAQPAHVERVRLLHVVVIAAVQPVAVRLQVREIGHVAYCRIAARGRGSSRKRLRQPGTAPTPATAVRLNGQSRFPGRARPADVVQKGHSACQPRAPARSHKRADSAIVAPTAVLASRSVTVTCFLRTGRRRARDVVQLSGSRSCRRRPGQRSFKRHPAEARDTSRSRVSVLGWPDAARPRWLGSGRGR